MAKILLTVVAWIKVDVDLKTAERTTTEVVMPTPYQTLIDFDACTFMTRDPNIDYTIEVGEGEDRTEKTTSTSNGNTRVINKIMTELIVSETVEEIALAAINQRDALVIRVS